MRQIEKIKTVLFLFTLAVTQLSDTQADVQDGKSPLWGKVGALGNALILRGKFSRRRSPQVLQVECFLEGSSDFFSFFSSESKIKKQPKSLVPNIPDL